MSKHRFRVAIGYGGEREQAKLQVYMAVVPLPMQSIVLVLGAKIPEGKLRMGF
jgi:hypothetical protein